VTAAEWPLSQLLVQSVLLLGPVLALLAAVPAGVPPPAWLGALVTALALGWAFLPESVLGTLVLALVLVWWVVADLTSLPWEAIAAALCLVAAHVAAVVASYGPAELEVDEPTLRLWLGRAGVLSLAAPVVWLLGRLLADRPEPPGVWVAAMVAVVIAAVVAAVAYGSTEGDPARDT
jgi:hypothetical protein